MSGEGSARDLSDIVKAYDVRGVVGEELDAALVGEIAAAFATVVAEEGAGCVVVGHDMRESSPALATAFVAGVTAAGLDAVSIGLASTDMLYFASGWLDMPGAMFTASHNPARYNGIKMCRAGAAPVGSDTGLERIRELVERGETSAAATPGATTERDLRSEYAGYLRKLVDLSDVRRMRVAVDAGNGMAGYTVPEVFDGLPVDVVPLYFELDGTFPNHEANPLDPTNLVDLQLKVREVGADLGLAFDGDADRCFVVDERGEPISPSAVTALVAVREIARAQRDGEQQPAVIHNLITSRAVPEIVVEHGGHPVRTRVGHSFIKAEMASTDAIFGGEHSAHYYFRDFWRADTGMLAALHVLAELGGQQSPASELAAEYSRYAASGEVNSTVTDQAEKMAAVKAAFAESGTVDVLDGLTVTMTDGSWFNLRPSNTEPLLRLNVEAVDDAAVVALRDAVLTIVRG